MNIYTYKYMYIYIRGGGWGVGRDIEARRGVREILPQVRVVLPQTLHLHDRCKSHFESILVALLNRFRLHV